MILGDFNTHLSPIDRLSRDKLSKDSSDLEINIVNQMDLTDIYRMFHPPTTEYSFFLAAHAVFSKIYHKILDHKGSLNSMLSDHNGMKSEIIKKIKNRSYFNTWKLNNTLLNDE